MALLIETSRSYARGILRGVRRYLSEQGPWSLFLEARDLRQASAPWLARWRGDGILTRTIGAAMGRAVKRTGAPAVELRATRLATGFPFVGVDNAAIGRMTAEHLLERGFRSFGCVETRGETYFEQRRDDFVRRVVQEGGSCAVYSAFARREKPREWERQQRDLERWVRSLPKPVGLMACTDQLAFWLVDACRRAGVSVPEQAAVIGVEDDETLATMAQPPLSSVRFNADRTGYEAARLLDRLMAGKAAPAGPLLIEPLGIVTRQSTDVVAVADAPVAQALRFIRERACGGIGVGDVVRSVPLSRSLLERRMRKAIGRSPKEEILRVRFAKARELLASSELPIARIAELVGFNHPQYLCEAFARRFGEAPGAYRRRLRNG